MGNVLETVLGVVIALVIVCSGSMILNANNEAIKAENYLRYVAEKYSASDFNESVLRVECEKAKSEYGYEITCLRDEDEKDIVVRDENGSVIYGALKIVYPYKVPFFGLDELVSKTIIVY